MTPLSLLRAVGDRHWRKPLAVCWTCRIIHHALSYMRPATTAKDSRPVGKATMVNRREDSPSTPPLSQKKRKKKKTGNQGPLPPICTPTPATRPAPALAVHASRQQWPRARRHVRLPAHQPDLHYYPFTTVAEPSDFCQKLTRWSEAGSCPHLDSPSCCCGPSPPRNELPSGNPNLHCPCDLAQFQFRSLFPMPVNVP